jgi:hypothetical protein
MKKTIQLNVNDTILEALYEYNKYCDTANCTAPRRLDYCTAETFNVGSRYTTLRSYNTIVAFYDHETNILYDVLRYVYGYTATSAKHIAKFRRMMNPVTELRWDRV